MFAVAKPSNFGYLFLACNNFCTGEAGVYPYGCNGGLGHASFCRNGTGGTLPLPFPSPPSFDPLPNLLFLNSHFVNILFFKEAVDMIMTNSVIPIGAALHSVIHVWEVKFTPSPPFFFLYCIFLFL